MFLDALNPIIAKKSMRELKNKRKDYISKRGYCKV